MKRYYFETNNKKPNYKYYPLSRYIKIRFNASGNAYIIYNGKRIYLDNIMRLSYPIMLEDTDGKIIVLSGYDNPGFCSRLFELDPNSEYMRIWSEKEIDE